MRPSAKNVPTPCWTCNEMVAGAVCVGCGAPQPPPPTFDPYAALGLPRRWFLAEGDVEQAYRALARKLHPDRFAGKAPAWRRLSLQWTAMLNDARRVLKDPDRRAWWLATGSPTPRETGGPRLDPVFLEEIFEWKERELEEPGFVRAQAQAREADLRAELEQIFRRWEAGEGDLSQVEDRLSRLTYIVGLAREKDHGEHRD